MSAIVPFGKYKGQPVEVMAQDKNYMDWLKAQNWFQGTALYTVIINNFGAPSETPEHNAMQALFLDEEFRLALGRLDGAGLRKLDFQKDTDRLRQSLDIAENNLRRIREGNEDWERRLEAERARKPRGEDDDIPFVSDWRIGDLVEAEARVADAKSVLQAHSDAQLKVSSSATFEERGVDVRLSIAYLRGKTYSCYEALIELKPQVGDDYPAILRQMKNSRATTLVTKSFTSSGVTAEQIRAIFKSSGIQIYTLDQINEQIGK